MAKNPQEAQEVFNQVSDVVFSTSRSDGQPNCCIVGMKKLIDDETIYLSDQFFKKTLANILENPKVCVIWWGEKGAYEVYGTATYVNEGTEFETQAEWANSMFEKIGMSLTAKGGCFIKVDEVYTSSPGPMAGEKIA